MEHHKNLFQSLLLGGGFSFAAYSSQLINGFLTLGLAVISTVVIYYVNKLLKKISP